MTVHVNVDLTDDQKAQLDDIARRQDTSAEALIAALVQDKLDYEARFRSAVEEGIAAADRGEYVTHEEVVARAKLRAAHLLGDSGLR
ncbi:MAG: hypothetical protein ABI655_13690 [Phenylobacterium sp.]